MINDPVQGSLNTSIDDFGQKIFNYFSRGGIFDSDVHIISGLLSSFKKIAFHAGVDYLTIIFWSSTIYVHYFDSKSFKACPGCLLQAISRNLSFDGPDIQQIQSESTLVSQEIYFDENILETIFLLVQFALKKNIHFQCGSNILVYSIESGNVSFPVLFSEPGCDYCGEKMRFSPMELVLQKNDTVGHNSTRQHTLEYFSHFLQSVSSAATGFVSNILYDLQLPVASVSAELVLEKHRRELTLGRSRYYSVSQKICVVEALERFCGLRGGVGVRTLFDSYNNLTSQAIYPPNYSLHSTAQYALNNFPFTTFSPDKKITWVTGLDIIKNKPVYVPIAMAFYGFKYSQQYPLFAFETSNGCAVGSSYAEAILAGLLELIERDSFLRVWYERESLMDVTVAVLRSREVTALYKRMHLYNQMEIRFYNSTRSHGIPTLFALAYKKEKSKPNFAAAAGVGLTLEQAAISALYELSCHSIRLEYLLAQPGAWQRAESMLVDAYKVIKMEDHGLVNALPGAESRFSFLLDSVSGAYDETDGLLSAKNPEQTLACVIHRLEKQNISVVAVDQTLPLMKSQGLFCVKVLAEHMLPMTFGHQYTRLSEVDLATIYPHPFP